MRKKIIHSILLLFIFLGVAIGQANGGKLEMLPKKTIYQVMWNSSNVTGRILINGFEIGSVQGPSATGTTPINIWMVGNNQLQLELKKEPGADPAQFSVNVSALEVSEIAMTNQVGNLVALELSDADFNRSPVIAITKDFKSTLDFSSHLLATPKVTITEKDVVDYAAKIYALFEKKDSNGLLKEFSVKLDDYSTAYYDKTLPDQFKALLTNEYFKNKLVKVNPKNLQAKKTSPTSNLWHVYDGQKELIRVNEKDGAVAEMPIFIGLVNGQLKVVR
ncbi:MAG: hypothetical protein WCT39_04650 [Candidatus Margulisiibacteriota bacterium]